MTRMGRFYVYLEGSFLKTSYEINKLINKLLFGIEFAFYYYREKIRSTLPIKSNHK